MIGDAIAGHDAEIFGTVTGPRDRNCGANISLDCRNGSAVMIGNIAIEILRQSSNALGVFNELLNGVDEVAKAEQVGRNTQSQKFACDKACQSVP